MLTADDIVSGIIMNNSCPSAHCVGTVRVIDNPSNKNDPSTVSCSKCSESFFQCQICTNKPFFKQNRQALSRHRRKYHAKGVEED